MENLKEIEARAKKWLIDKVEKKLTWTNFEITNTNDVVLDHYKKTVLFKFQCKYTWTLNCWPKNVDQELYVTYLPESDEFRSILF